MSNSFSQNQISATISNYKVGHKNISDVADILHFLATVLDDPAGGDLVLTSASKDGLAKLLKILFFELCDGTENIPLPDVFAKMFGKGADHE